MPREQYVLRENTGSQCLTVVLHGTA